MILGLEDGSNEFIGGREFYRASRGLLRTWLGREPRRVGTGGVGVGSEIAALDSNPRSSISRPWHSSIEWIYLVVRSVPRM